MELIAVILVILLVAGMFVYHTLSWGLVLFKFWGWFVLPVFTTLPVITFAQAIGLMFVIGLFTGTSEIIKKEYKEEWSVWIGLAYPWLTLIFGWIGYNLFVV